MIREALISAALAVVTLAAYRGVASSSFIVFDDNGYVTENAEVKRGLDAEAIAWAFTTGAQANWHPVTWLSHMLDVSLFGLAAGKHHATSLLIHVANVVLLFLLLVRMTGAVWRSAFVACLFAIHPLHVESVAWIAERKDVLSFLFWLLTLWAWLRYLDARTPKRYALVVVFYALGLMSKPMLVTLPFTLLLLDFWPLNRAAFPPLLKEKLPLFAMSAASCVATFAVQHAAGAVQTLQRIAFDERAGNALLAYATYLGKTFRPASLSIFYPYPEGVGLLTLASAGSLLLLCGVTLAAWRTRKTAPFFVVGWLWYLGTLVPVIGLVQVGGQAMADRYTYVPLIGIFVVISWGLEWIARDRNVVRFAATGAAVFGLCALFVVTRAQVGFWTGDVPLFRHALDVTAGNWLAHNNLGRGLYAEGRVDEAIVEYEAALAISPGYSDAHYNLGIALARNGKRPEAIEQFQEALRLAPDFADAYNNLGGVLAESGRIDEAVAQYEQAIRLDPRNAEAPYNLGNAQFALGRFDAAIAQYERAIALRPDLAEAHNNLGSALVRAGRAAEGIAQYELALRLNPELAEAKANLEAVKSRTGLE